MEKSQEQIRFENLYLDSKGGFWKHYAPHTLGSVIHWLHVFGTLNIAENVQLGDGKITWYGRPMLKYKYTEENPNVPFFYDLEYDEFKFIMINQDVYLDGIKKFPNLVAEIDEKYDEYRELFNRPKASNNN